MRPPVELSDIEPADHGGLWALESLFLRTNGLIVSMQNLFNGRDLSLRELISRAATVRLLAKDLCNVRDVIDSANERTSKASPVMIDHVNSIKS